MSPKKWRGTLLYLGILGASVGVVGARMLPASGALSDTGTPGVSSTSGASSAPAVPSTPGRASASPTTAPKASKSASASKAPAVTVKVTGKASQTRYGPVQVALTFKGSKITNVTVLQTPSRDGRSVQIASRSVPTLHDEVLKSQSAKIDTVSGATYTSDGYAQSVQSAIDQHG